jgi:hypothetical protein
VKVRVFSWAPIFFKTNRLFIDFGCTKSNHSVYNIDSLNMIIYRS